MYSIKFRESLVIKIVRMLAMCSIVICHIQQAYDNKWAWIFNAGVQLFLAISGWLYGKKDIIDFKKWIKLRLYKIYIPYLLYIIMAYICYNIYCHAFSFSQLVIYILDIQWFMGCVKGLDHLWFMTAIAICYIITPLLQLLRKKYPLKSLNTIIIFFFLNLLFFKFLIGYSSAIFVYVLSYFLSGLSKKVFLVYFWFIFGLFLYILTFIDWDIILNYSDPINKLFHVCIGILNLIAPVIIIKMIPFSVVNCINKISNLLKVDKLVDYSYYLYLTHHIFIIGPFSMAYISNNYSTNVLIMLFMSITTCMLLKFISENINILLNRQR